MPALLRRMSHTGAASSTSLTANMSPTDTTFTIASAAGWPTGAGGQPFVAVIDPGQSAEEKIWCSSITGLTVNVFGLGGRGFDNTVATSHNSGAAVEHVLAAVEVDDDNRHVYMVSDDDHTQYARADGGRNIVGHQTFTAGITDTGVFDQTGVSHLRGNTDVTGTLSSTGDASLGGALTVTGNATLNSNLTVTGNETVTGNSTIGGNATADSYTSTGLPGATAGARWAGNTVAGPPTTGAFNAGDWIIDDAGVVYMCRAAGSPGLWTVPVGGLVATASGPAAQTDYLAAGANVLTLTAGLVSGRSYQLALSLSAATQVSVDSAVCQVYMTDSAGYLPGSGSEVRAILQPIANAAVVAGGTTWVIKATATATDTFTVKAASAAGALRVSANTIQFTITRIA